MSPPNVEPGPRKDPAQTSPPLTIGSQDSADEGQVDDPCIGCGNPASFTTPTGHRACAQCTNTGPTLSDTLDDLSAFISRYIAFTSDHQLVAVTLWAAHTHLAQRLRTTPYLHITSPEPESGKSQLLDVLELVTHQPWVVVMPSPAVLYRKIDKAQEDGGLTLLLDEIDPIFKRGSDDGAEALRAVLNSGYQKGRTVPRCVGPSQKLVDFAVYGPKALAGIGDVPDTIASRSIRIGMKRRKPSERVDPLFPDEIIVESEALRERVADKVANIDLDYLFEVRRELLQIGLGDRSADGWSSLLVIADEASGSWPRWARDAAKDLSRKQTTDSASLGLKLLTDVREVWEGERMFSSVLRDKLIDLDEAPWGDFFGKPISQHRVSRYLSEFDAHSKQIRIDDESKKGYLIKDLEDAWARWLGPVSPLPPDQTETRNTAGQSDISSEPGDDVSISESAILSTSSRDVSDVSIQMQDKGPSGPIEEAEEALEDAGFDFEEMIY